VRTVAGNFNKVTERIMLKRDEECNLPLNESTIKIEVRNFCSSLIDELEKIVIPLNQFTKV
jgi:hypothetical protein